MLKQGLSQRLLQKLSPQQIQFIQLLQLNSTEFEKRVDEEMTENPALETEEKAEDTPEAEQEFEEPAEEPQEKTEEESYEEDLANETEPDLSEYMAEEGDDYNYADK